MSLSQFPFNVVTSSCAAVCPSESSLQFLVLQSHSSSGSKNLKSRINCSNRSTHVETEEPQQIKVTSSTTAKKKRKLKSSFYEQIRDKWSLNIPSQREKLPWQENQEFQQVQVGTQLYSEVLNTTADESVSFSLGNRLIAAPWIQKDKPRKSHFKSDNETTSSNGEAIAEVHVNGASGSGENLTTFEGEANYTVKFKEENQRDRVTDPVLKINQNLASVKGSQTNKILDMCDFVDSNDERDSIRLPWERKNVEQDKWKRNNAILAEKLVPGPELQRLRNIALRMKERIKVGAGGITQIIVDSMNDKWKVDEVVKLKFEGPLAMNMKRTHELLESKTGGLVIWRSGTSLVLHRGMGYKLPCVQTYTKKQNNSMNASQLTSDVSQNIGVKDYLKGLSEEDVDKSNLNNLLDELGPRFNDWAGCDPLPVDADLLPNVVPGYKPPFRLLPHKTRHCLTDREMTSFRRLARTMPPHFALGRNRELQGLAMAMVKLWETNAIAKIAIKRGVENTRNERMAEEIRKLTGGTLLSRNKDYIVFYRGNDFMPPGITEALTEREKLTELRQNEEEQARLKASASIGSDAKTLKVPLVAGTLAETMAATSRWGKQPSSKEMEKIINESISARQASLVRYLEKKLAVAKAKVIKAEKALGKVQEFLRPNELPTDLETISDEERFLFRKMGLSMKPFLLLGRRGMFDGTVENMHLHWKYRELVKIIVSGKSFSQVKHIAISLEAESGGVLVSLDKTTKGYAIIVYRGKNYQRPHPLKPKNLLTKRQALARSIELQRREALMHHISDLQERIRRLKSELEETESRKDLDNETMCRKFSDAYSSDNEMEEDEGEEAYLQVYDSGYEDNDIQ